MEGLQASIPRGKSAEWLVGVWATGANASGSTVRLSVAPAGQKAAFSVGCATNGKASCSLGALKAGSTVRMLQARVAVPATATSVTSVRLTAIAGATNAVTGPKAAVTISVTAPGTAAVAAQVTPLGGGTGISPLPVGYLPYLKGTGATLSPGGNATGLFPAITPSAYPSASSQSSAAGSPVAETFPLSKNESVMDAQIAGIAALALAIALTVTGLLFRRGRTPFFRKRRTQKPDPPGPAASAAGAGESLS
ncbi:MAG TPA: hypothetical protein VH589_17460 [Trebonia sp.]